MNTIERAKEIARLYTEIQARTEELEALLGGGTLPVNRHLPQAPKTVAASSYKSEGYKKGNRAPTTCGQCGRPGHTRRTCPGGGSNDTPENEPFYPEDQYADEIRRMTQNGASPKVIAEVLDIPIQTVSKVLNTRTL